ncbi:MAG: aldolase/citrate lyase family protein [Eubacteriales bacterium]|nr:aldolase/citrate lyase family protein [Eubacteriales bacterium]
MNRITKIKEKMEKKELCFGTHISTQDPDFYEVSGYMGYDYVWIDNEHAGMTQPMIKNAIIATNAGGAAAFVRVPDHQMCNVKPVIECGPDGIIFPMVNTAEQARQCVAHCTYPPKGTRGFGPLRGIDYGLMDFDEYVRTADDRCLHLMQCEHKEAVKNLDEILEVPGVDVIICGPMDLSGSIGKMGQFSDPEMISLMQEIIDKCKAHNKPFGLSFGLTDTKLMDFWIGQGATFFSLGTPLDYFREMGMDTIRLARKMEAERN